MMLQSDPTVLYALGEWKKRTYYSDLDVQSPYNTYRNRGLPPGPICSPGRAAFHAVLFPGPDSTEFYFVARGDGTHIFSRTWENHLKAIARVRAQARRESTLVPIGPGIEPAPVVQAGPVEPSMTHGTASPGQVPNAPPAAAPGTPPAVAPTNTPVVGPTKPPRTVAPKPARSSRTKRTPTKARKTHATQRSTR
jgi:hypothetical protein